MIDRRIVDVMYDENIKESIEQVGVVNFSNASIHFREMLVDAFMRGAETAISELWHDASEEPIYDKDLLACVERGCLRFILCKCFPHVPWNTYVDNMGVVKWCYIDDILPKEGGEQ